MAVMERRELGCSLEWVGLLNLFLGMEDMSSLVQKNLSKDFIEGEMVRQINGLPLYFGQFTS